MSKTTMLRLAAGALSFAAVLSNTSDARAHVSLEQKDAAHGTYKAVFKVPHGCKKSPTTAVMVDIPEGVIGVKPMPKPGWTILMEKGAYAKTYDYFHGLKVAEGIKKVTWKGGNLPDEFFDEFVLSVYLTSDLPTGKAVYFPVKQTCETGELSWSQIPTHGQDPHALDAPAPGVKILVAADGGDQHRSHGASAGAIKVEQPWTRATPGGAKVAAGYVKLSNTSQASDRLMGGTFARAGRVEVHEMKMEGEVMKMRELTEGLEIGAGQSAELSPGGTHLMFLDLSGGLQAGETITGVLQFEKAGGVPVEFSVAPLGAAAPAAGHSHH